MKSNNGDSNNYGNADLSALIGGDDEYFNDVDKTENKTLGFGRNSGLEYKNKYSMASAKLASNDVVDVSKFKKKVEPEKPKVSEIIPEEKDEDLLNSSLSETSDQQTDDDDDSFDKFFEEFMRDLDNKEDGDNAKTEQNTEEQTKVIEQIEEPPKLVTKKQPSTRKKKRAIDIDIISGGVGGDII